MRLSADRLTAAHLLLRVERGAFSSRVVTGETPPAARVRVLEVLRWLRALDAVLQPLCRRPLAKLDPEVRVALRLGLVETMRLGVAPALATDGSVRLVRRLGCSSASGMVNAVLRKAVKAWPYTLERSPVNVALSHPGWIYERWQRNFGDEETVKSMASAQERAVTWVWFRNEAARERIENEGIKLETHPWCPEALSAPQAPGRLVQEVIAGAAYAQDPSSQIVARTALELTGGEGSFVDLCAAPGGKTALLMQLGSWRRAAAADLRPTRARLVFKLLQIGGSAPVVVADATCPPFEPGGWDLVLLDAPCTGTGTFRRHPEIKWRLNRESITEMAALQREMILAARDLVAPGGVLMYATCSIEPEENEGVVEALAGGLEAVDLGLVIPDGTPWRETDAGGARILPNADGDGFTMHAMRRVR
ncbi:MAG: RsmB/NOP family class I SAM-dependent RNA methyltransferase [Acidobacteriota bacterium]|nr:RsmB/NOP family class I SAM-dependent RNA methyltransferase [Acidobacteriota bacterium]